ncbi:hypothetical protein ACROYT_G002082 [Oculina patagonica]
MDEDEQDVYVAQLHEVFDSCDRAGKGFLNRSELVELCKKLQLDDQVPQLLQQLLGSVEAEGQVTFDDFKEGFVAVLSQAIEQLSSSEDEEEQPSDSTTAEPPKLVVNEKRYGRWSRPEASYSEDLYSADDESMIESRPESRLSDSHITSEADHHDAPAREEKPKLERRLSSRKSSLRNSIRRHNSKQRKSREDSVIVTDSDVLEGGGLLSASPHPDGANSGYESPSEEEQLRAIWNEVNVGATGYLDKHELSVVCDHIGMDSMNEQELALLFEELDEDGDGQVSFNEFLHGLFAAKDLQQSDIEPEWEQPQQSTPYNQPPPANFTTKGQRRSVNHDDSFFLSRTGGSSSAFDLLTLLDPENTGFAKKEDIKDFWLAQGLNEAIPLLEHLEIDVEGKVSLHQLTNLLESVVEEQSDGLPKAVVNIYKHEVVHLKSQVETVAAERDALKENLVKFTEEKEMLIVESEDTAQKLEKMHETKLRDQESHFTEKMQTLQQTLVEERDKVAQNADKQRSMLEESLHSTKTEEQRLRTKLAEAEEEILRLEKALSESQEKLIESENNRERLEKELESMSDLSSRLAEVEKQQLLKQQQNQKNSKTVRELERINRELRDENDELRLQCEALTQQVNSSVKRRPSHRKRHDSQKVQRHGSVLSDYTKPVVIKRNKEGVTSSDDSDTADQPDGTRVPSVRVSGDGGSNEDADDSPELEEQRKVIEKLEGELKEKEEQIKCHKAKVEEQESSISEQVKLLSDQKLSLEEFQGKVEQLGDKVRDQEAQLKAKEATIQELKNDIDGLSGSLASDSQETRQRYDTELANLTSQFTGEMEGLQKNFNLEKEQLEKEYQAKMKDMERSLKSEQESLKEELESGFRQAKGAANIGVRKREIRDGRRAQGRERNA